MCYATDVMLTSFGLALSFALSLIVSAGCVPFVIRFATRIGAVDVPRVGTRKLHDRPTPLWGGIAIGITFVAVLGVIAAVTGAPFEGRIHPHELLTVFCGVIILLIGGAIDDRYQLSPRQQFIAPFLAVMVIAAAGVGISRITNPFGGGFLSLVPFVTVLFTVVWVLSTTFTMKLLDGLDGLVTGTTAIGALLIAALSLTHAYYQPDVALIAFVLAGSCLGFLIFNFHPARIFLGEGGATVCGYLLGILAIISGGKIATALLVLGIPATDVILVMIQRIARRESVFRGDRSHLHFRLLDLGFSHRGAVWFLWGAAALFGAMTLVLQARQKLIAIAILGSIAIGLSFVALLHQQKRKTPDTDASGRLGGGR
jgi:UDP-GlcNAc:undecaprenyl-phosphate/decaprenyl-phosphate GlcNAc-1-phosphate transferase